MKKSLVIAIVTAVVFGAAYAAFALSAPHLWNSPDETAVAFFADSLASTGRLWWFEPANLFGGGLVHPRSIIAMDDYLLPGSFYGAMFFFGGLVKVMGPIALALGTPFMTALASLIVYWFMRRSFDARRGHLAQLLFLANPAVWYFASRGLFPNLLFLDLVIIGAGILYLRPWKTFAKDRGHVVLGALIDDLVGVAFFGAAFLVRPVEYLWLAPLIVAALVVYRRRLTWWRMVATVLMIALFVGAFLFTNNSIYGSPWSVGYTAGAKVPGVAVPALSQGSTLPAAITAPRPFVLPFGFHPRAGLTNLLDYVVLFAWWLPALAVIGFFLTKNKPLRRRAGYAFLWTAGALGIYYGSGIFTDSSVSQWTIGSSYIRYFLPALLLLIPLAAEGVALLPKKRGLIAAIMAVFIGLGVWTVYFRSPESLVPMRATLFRYAQIKETVLKEVKPNNIIVTERSDKIFFPDRKVVVGLREPAVLDELPRFVAMSGAYYYGITLAEAELPTINKELAKRGLQLGRVKSFDNETLYSITKIQK